ncbi:MAG: asparagine synthase (glutamine-hydrolyzing) [Saprospiraceae bacterium]|nr:asparagine synthase (glutamine-hydrolyzing) [Saprospiraceae bacterium]
MCGLSGIYHLDGAPIETTSLLKMNRLIRHRGPDDEGYLLINTKTGAQTHHFHDDSIAEIKKTSTQLPESTTANLGIAFRRLSIIDLSVTGHQPMSDQEQNCWITFNGEIYNYIEIKNELQSLGHRFISGSDTEVLLHSYKQWGTHCLERFIGMFVFVIYNHKERTLFLARDRIGIKPFNYYFDGNRFVWASEEKQFSKSNLVTLSPNEFKMVEFLRDNKSFEDTDTFFKEIKQLAAGHFALINQNGLTITKYWDLPKQVNQISWNETQSIESIQSLLKDSIKLRLRSDVPLGVALSGGIDSSSVCCIARSLTDTSIQTFSVYYEGIKYDERKYIKAVLDTGGFKSTFYSGSHDVNLNEIKNWIYQQDAPTTGASPFSAFQNYKNVKNAGIIVLLNGQGGDELYAGYPYFIKYYLAQLLKDHNYSEYGKTIYALTQNQGIKKVLSHAYLSWKVLQKNSSVVRQLEHQKYATRNLYPNTLLQNNFPNEDSFIDAALSRSIKQTHLPHMLRWEDRNSMANSIESRVPFLDHRLVESSFNIPASLKLHHGVNKYILRQSMKNIVPDIILNRKDKIGFGTPTTLWTHTTLAPGIQDIIQSKEFLDRPWWNGKAIRSKFEKNPYSFGENELWRILSSELWYQSFFN